jgi:hypothetical protein
MISPTNMPCSSQRHRGTAAQSCKGADGFPRLPVKVHQTRFSFERNCKTHVSVKDCSSTTPYSLEYILHSMHATTLLRACSKPSGRQKTKLSSPFQPQAPFGCGLASGNGSDPHDPQGADPLASAGLATRIFGSGPPMKDGLDYASWCIPRSLASPLPCPHPRVSPPTLPALL